MHCYITHQGVEWSLGDALSCILASMTPGIQVLAGVKVGRIRLVVHQVERRPVEEVTTVFQLVFIYVSYNRYIVTFIRGGPFDNWGGGGGLRKIWK